jgi:hypothetical protein
MSYLVRGSFLKEMREYFDALPDVANQAAVMALNQVAERQALPMIHDKAEAQVNFPKGYLDSPDRLGISRKASRGSLEAVITARDRPTSLARFAPGQTPKSTAKRGVTVSIKKGRVTHIGKAFLVTLNNGNIGLATRDKSLVSRAYKPVQLDRGVYLLYGPSVDQVVRTVAEDAMPKIGEKLSTEFLRQFARLSRG